MMKKKITYICLTLLCLPLILTGCGGDAKPRIQVGLDGKEHYVIYDWDDYYEVEEEIARKQKAEYEEMVRARMERELAEASAEGLECTVLDVEQGLCVLARCADSTLLYDTGSSPYLETVLDAMEEQGITTLDYLILSHMDEDHMGSAMDILEQKDVKMVLLEQEGLKKETECVQYLADLLQEGQYPLTDPGPGDTFPLGDAQITILAPATNSEEQNNNSIIAKITYGDTSVLLSGDSEQEETDALLESGQDIDSDVYVVSHHGSYNGTSQEYLDAITPEYAIISCGLGNDYGHPHPSTMSMLAGSVPYLYRTDLQGSIHYASDGESFHFLEEPCEDYSCGDDLQPMQGPQR